MNELNKQTLNEEIINNTKKKREYFYNFVILS
jgi:hypothetical protein